MKESDISPEELQQALQELRAQKNDESSPGWFVYQMLSTAHPTVHDMLEHQAALFLASGKRVASVIREASRTSEGRQRIDKELSRIMSGITPKKSGEDSNG